MKNFLLSLSLILGLTNAIVKAEQVHFAATITNSLNQPITIFDRMWEGNRVKLAVVQPGGSARITDLSVNVQNIFSRSTIIVAKGDADIAEIIFSKQARYGIHKPAIAIHMLPFPHWIGNSHMIREELDENRNRFEIYIDLKQDEKGTLDPSTFSIAS